MIMLPILRCRIFVFQVAIQKLKNQDIYIYIYIILPVVFMGVKLGH